MNEEVRSDPTKRFSARAENYARYRAGYPDTLLEYLRAKLGLEPSWTIADIGSGTGILSKVFLDNGNAVFGVEPNDEMRAAGEAFLKGCAGFNSIAARAEETSLPDQAVDLIAAAQAFHWFDVERTKAEWRRILRPGGWAALIWNSRRNDASPFMRDYEDLLKRRCPDYARVNHCNVGPETFDAFFESYEWVTFDHSQRLDYGTVLGRMLSASYVPMEHEPGHNEILHELRCCFDRSDEAGFVSLEYTTELYVGRL